MTKRKTEKLLLKGSYKKTCEWLSTSECQEKLKNAIKEGTPFSDKIKKARNISPETLRQPLNLL